MAPTLSTLEEGTFSDSYVFLRVLPQSFLGVSAVGIFYGWGALTDEINMVFNPDNPSKFSNQHGTFLGVAVLVLLITPMPILQYFLSKKYFTEFQIHAIGLLLTSSGFVLGAISLQYKLLWLLYVGCIFPCGIGEMCIFYRIIFNHQLWFNKIGKKNLGSGLFGFFIGIWTVISFVVSVPLLDYFSIVDIFYIYAIALLLLGLWPLLSAKDTDSVGVTAKTKIAKSTPKVSPVVTPIPIKPNGTTADQWKSGHVTPIAWASESYSDSLPSEQIRPGAMTSDTVKPFHARDEPQKASPISPLNKQIIEQKKMPARSLYDSDGVDRTSFALTTVELLMGNQVWLLNLFQVTMLTPGWGIKLASFSIITHLFGANRSFAAAIASAYVACYALGRLLAGSAAELVGIYNAYTIIMSSMCILLLMLLIPLRLLSSDKSNSFGCILFSSFIFLIGLLYGGGQALFYSIVFDIFGAVNYKSAWTLSSFGFSIAVVIGGLSSAYSFSGPQQGDAARALAESWFYCMAAATFVGLCIIYMIHPFDYATYAIKKDMRNSMRVRTRTQSIAHRQSVRRLSVGVHQLHNTRRL